MSSTPRTIENPNAGTHSAGMGVPVTFPAVSLPNSINGRTIEISNNRRPLFTTIPQQGVPVYSNPDRYIREQFRESRNSYRCLIPSTSYVHESDGRCCGPRDLSESPSVNFSENALCSPREHLRQTTSTNGLVTALNSCSTEFRQEQIKSLIDAYISELEDKRLAASWGKACIEFANLFKLNATTAESNRIMRSLFRWFLENAKKEIEDESFLAALIKALQCIDVKIFEGDPQQLIQLAMILLDKIDPEKTHFHKPVVSKHSKILQAVRCLLQVISQMEPPIEWDMSKEDGPFQKISQKVIKISNAASDFPVKHGAKLVQQTTLQLGSRDGCKQFHRGSKKMWKIFKGLAKVWNTMQSLLSLRLDLESAESALNLLKDDTVQYEVSQKWFCWIQCLNAMAMYAMEDPTKLPCLWSGLEFIMKNESGLPKEDRKHLRYEVLTQVTMLALYGSSQADKKRMSDWLKHLIDSEDDMTKDPDIMEIGNKCLMQIIQSEQETAGCASSSSVVHMPLPHQVEQQPHDSLFAQIKRNVLSIPFDWDLRRESSVAPEIAEALKAGYVDDVQQGGPDISGHNKCIPSFTFNLGLVEDVSHVLSPYAPASVDGPLGRQLVMTNHKTKIELAELFPVRGGASRVLVMGMPGSGKSSLARRLTMEWSNGSWGTRFETVFLLSVGNLIKEARQLGEQVGPSLAASIVCACFGHIDTVQHFPELIDFVRGQLKNPNTLLILDGLDEAKRDASGYSDGILKQAMFMPHTYKLLMLTSPAGIKREAEKADRVVELDYLTDEDMDQCLQGDRHICINGPLTVARS